MIDAGIYQFHHSMPYSVLYIFGKQNCCHIVGKISKASCPEPISQRWLYDSFSQVQTQNEAIVRQIEFHVILHLSVTSQSVNEIWFYATKQYVLPCRNDHTCGKKNQYINEWRLGMSITYHRTPNSFFLCFDVSIIDASISLDF